MTFFNEPHPDIMRCRGRIESSQTAILERLTVQDTRLNAHSAKIETLQKTSAWRTGAAAVMGVVAGFLGKNAL